MLEEIVKIKSQDVNTGKRRLQINAYLCEDLIFPIVKEMLNNDNSYYNLYLKDFYKTKDGKHYLFSTGVGYDWMSYDLLGSAYKDVDNPIRIPYEIEFLNRLEDFFGVDFDGTNKSLLILLLIYPKYAKKLKNNAQVGEWVLELFKRLRPKPEQTKVQSRRFIRYVKEMRAYLFEEGYLDSMDPKFEFLYSFR